MLLVLLSACVVTLGGWVLVAPALPRACAAAAEPPADLDVPRPTVFGAAASASASNAATRSVGAASDAGPASIDRSQARCGDDQAPVYADPVPDDDGANRGWPVQTKPAGVGYIGAQRRVDAALRATGDPFDAAVADALNVGDLRTPDDRLVALVQDANSADDPRLYELVFAICKNVPTLPSLGVFGVTPPAGEQGLRACARLDAHRWALRDPGNAVPWLYALDRADTTGDRAGQREALQQLGTTSRFEMGFGAAAAAVARVRRPDDADLAGQTNLAMQAVPFQLWPSFAGITMRCKDKAAGDATMLPICEHVADVLYAHSDGMMPRIVGASIHRLATGDASRLEGARAEYKELAEKWQANVAAGADVPACDHARSFLRHFVLVGKVGEIEAMKQEIAGRVAPY